MPQTHPRLPGIDTHTTAGEALDRIRAESRNTAEKGTWFENLVRMVITQQPEFEIEEASRWADWPDREALLPHLTRQDTGIDLVAKRSDGALVAIQCKCYDARARVPKGDIDSFLVASHSPHFAERWVIATCRWSRHAASAIEGSSIPVKQIDFRQWSHVLVESKDARRPDQKPYPIQEAAIRDVLTGFQHHDRGRLIMACGTGKTFTSLRIAEKTVPDGGHVLFAAPSIALVSQARREWLQTTARPLSCIVVCSDQTAGKNKQAEDIRISELECPVTTDPGAIAKAMKSNPKATTVVFVTYQSLAKVCEAQAEFDAQAFDLAIADEAHRTTGALQDKASNTAKVDFQQFHDDEQLTAKRRLYMTATPRMYSDKSKMRLVAKGIGVVDMSDEDVYGPQFHYLPFKTALAAKRLTEYRVVVLGIGTDAVTPGIQRNLESIDTKAKGKQAPDLNDMTRALGVSLAINGVLRSDDGTDVPVNLPRSLAFSNSIARSKWYAAALEHPLVKAATTKQMEGDAKAMSMKAVHIDASANSSDRNTELNNLREATKRNECRVLCNVRLFTEGVDVPTLDAVAFLDPRDSQVDVVQAVGRVMRRAQGKDYGYIVIPVVVEPGQDVAEALSKGSQGYQAVGRVLRALQAHDQRLSENLLDFVDIYEHKTAAKDTKQGADANAPRTSGEATQGELHLVPKADTGIYAHVAEASGLGRPGQISADEITFAVRQAAKILQDEELETPLGEALGLVPEEEGGAKSVCTIAALILCNACLMQRRLSETKGLELVMTLNQATSASNPNEFLGIAWQSILNKDYEPIFRPALKVIRALPDNLPVHRAVRLLAECANRVGDSLNELGYDHAGPLYHKILGSAKSDGAYYTNNLSAIMLARLAFDEEFCDWGNPDAVANLRIIDPACGTGTLLMATLRTIMDRATEAQGLDGAGRERLHRKLVEDVLCGLDINKHAIQLAACNLTLGAPTVDYSRMNLLTMPHGPQPDGLVRAGSLELLNADAERIDLFDGLTPKTSFDDFDAQQVNRAGQSQFPLKGLDAVIMNAPFTDNAKRGRKFSRDTVKAMQQNELEIRNRLEQVDPEAAGVITTNSARTFFAPLANQLTQSDSSCLAMVVPVTACIGASGVNERIFLAKRYHIDHCITTHDPRRINFSENTSIHETLLILRRRQIKHKNAPTQMISLRQMPTTVNEALDCVNAIARREPISHWYVKHDWPAHHVLSGNWSPAQWCDAELTQVVLFLEGHTLLVPSANVIQFGATGRAAQDSWKRSQNDGDDSEGLMIFDSVSPEAHKAMLGRPDQYVVPGGRRAHLSGNVSKDSGHLLLAIRYNTNSGLLTATWSEQQSFGFGWIPTNAQNHAYEKALCAWWNSTPGRLLSLNRRAKTLTYPKWSKDLLSTMPVPPPNSIGIQALTQAWDETCTQPILPLWQATGCPVRAAIDNAAAVALDLDPQIIADWRQRLVLEPTISNKPYPS